MHTLSNKRTIRLISTLLTVIMCLLFIYPAVLADTTPSCISLAPDYQFSASANITSAWSGHANAEFTFTNTGSKKDSGQIASDG